MLNSLRTPLPAGSLGLVTLRGVVRPPLGDGGGGGSFVVVVFLVGFWHVPGRGLEPVEVLDRLFGQLDPLVDRGLLLDQADRRQELLPGHRHVHFVLELMQKKAILGWQGFFF